MRLGTLWRKDLVGDEPLVMVEVVNAMPEPDGSAKRYLLRVPPTIGSAREAVAWSFGKTAEEYGPADESRPLAEAIDIAPPAKPLDAAELYGDFAAAA